MQALCEGERDPERLAKRVHRSVRAKPEQLVEARMADLRPHHLVVLHELLTLLTALEQSIRQLEGEIERRLRPVEELIVCLEQITG